MEKHTVCSVQAHSTYFPKSCLRIEMNTERQALSDPCTSSMIDLFCSPNGSIFSGPVHSDRHVTWFQEMTTQVPKSYYSYKEYVKPLLVCLHPSHPALSTCTSLNACPLK